MLMMAVCLSLCLLTYGSRVSNAPIVEWVSSPVRPGELLLVNGGFFTPDVSATIHIPNGAPSTVKPVSVTEGVLTIRLPKILELVTFNLTVTNGDITSKPFPVNQAEPWWFLGDAGNTSTPGGWIRVFGKNLLIERIAGTNRALHRAAHSAAATGDFEEAHRLSISRSEQAAAGGSVTLRLQDSRTAQSYIDIESTASMVTSEFSAFFPVPDKITTGNYFASIRNNLAGGAFIPVEFIQSTMPGFENVSYRHSIAIVNPNPWPTNIIDVSSPKGLPPQGGYSDSLIDDAFSMAKKACGATVRFGPGKYMLSPGYSIQVPNNVKIIGAGSARTSIFFASVGNMSSNAPSAYIVAEGAELEPNKYGYTRWAIEDLSLYVYGAHNDIVVVANTTVGFEMRRVVIRANALFAAPHGVGVGGTKNVKDWQPFGPQGGADERSFGATMRIHGTNFVIDNCDLYGSGELITSQNSFNTSHPTFVGPSGTAWTAVHGVWWGRITNNKLFHAGASHRMNNWNQVLFENNTALGITLTAGGQALGTGPVGSICGNIFHHANTMQFVWGNDREVMTLDDAGGAYFGPVDVGKDGVTLTLAWDPIPGGHAQNASWPHAPFSTNGWAGAEVVVINGTGAGQLRRVMNPGVWFNYTSNNRTWVIDKPFDVPLGDNSYVEIQPYRGRIHFLGNEYLDTGAVQLYGHVSEVVVADNIGMRMTGFMMWGQWRGNFWRNTSLLGGSFGVGANPNVKILMLNNTHSDQGIVNFGGEDASAPGDGQSSWWTADGKYGSPLTVRDSPYGVAGHPGFHPGQPYPFLPLAKPHICMNCLGVLRGNFLEGEAEIWLGWYASSIIVESNGLLNGDMGVRVSNTTLSSITVSGNIHNNFPGL